MLRLYFNKNAPEGLETGGNRAYTGPMRTPSVLTLVVLLGAASPAFAQTATPAKEATPATKNLVCSGDWGTGADGQTLDDKIQKIFRGLVAEAHKGVVVNGKTVVYIENPKLVVDLRYATLGGSPAVAFAKGLGLNAPGRTIGGTDYSGTDLVYTTNALYEMCDRDHAAVFLAHELGHLAYDHAKQLEEIKKKLFSESYDKWAVTHTIPDDEPTDVTVKRFAKDSEADIMKALGEKQIPLEQQADEYGRELAVKTGVQDTKVAEAFARAQDWLWATKATLEDNAHKTVDQRRADSADWAAKRKKAAQDAADAARRAGCAAKGMSCQ